MENKYISAHWSVDLLNTDSVTHKYIDLPFSRDGDIVQCLDLYLPDTGNGLFPVILNVSGGGWYFGKKSSNHMGDIIFTGTKQGFAVASMACTSSRDKKFPYQIYEIKAAIRFLRSHAEEYSLDPNRIILWSASSGGHLSLMAALTDGDPYFDVPVLGYDGISATVQAIVSTYAICELGVTARQYDALGMTTPYPTSGPNCNEGILLGTAPEDDPELTALASPINHIHPDAPPIIMQHGKADIVVPVTQAYEFYEKYCRIAGAEKCTLHIIDDAGHSDPRFKDPDACEKICNQLKHLLP